MATHIGNHIEQLKLSIHFLKKSNIHPPCDLSILLCYARWTLKVHVSNAMLLRNEAFQRWLDHKGSVLVTEIMSSQEWLPYKGWNWPHLSLSPLSLSQPHAPPPHCDAFHSIMAQSQGPHQMSAPLTLDFPNSRRILYPLKLLSKNEFKIKTFSDKPI
jgi:hypothetical protein